MSHIRKRGKVYQARWVDPSGKERAKTFDRKQQAVDHLAMVDHTKRAGSYVDPQAGRITVQEYAERWRATLDHRDSTADNLRLRLKGHLYPQLGSWPMGSLTPMVMREWQAGRLKVLEASTVRSFRGQVSMMLATAVVDKVIGSNPLDSVKAPKVVTEKVVPPTVEAVAKLQRQMPERYQAVIGLVKRSGLRPSEAFGLTADRIWAPTREIRVDRQLLRRERGGAPVFGPPKTASSDRVVPVPQSLIDDLRAHVERFGLGQQGLVFHTGRDGGAINRKTFMEPWGRARADTGLEQGDGLHQIRHFYASLLIAHGASVKEVQARMGHKSAMETLDTYAHLWPDADETTRARIEGAFSEARTDDGPTTSDQDEQGQEPPQDGPPVPSGSDQG